MVFWCSNISSVYVSNGSTLATDGVSLALSTEDKYDDDGSFVGEYSDKTSSPKYEEMFVWYFHPARLCGQSYLGSSKITYIKHFYRYPGTTSHAQNSHIPTTHIPSIVS